jgi:hypothetical protein
MKFLFFSRQMPKIILPAAKINKESLTTKRSLILIGLTAVCGGYLLFLAIAAPQQLAEATTTAASNVVCSGCVGSSDIADNSILSADISNGRIFSEDIRDGQVGSVDIGTGQVTTGDIQDNGITSADLGNVITIEPGVPTEIPAGFDSSGKVDCPSGKILTGGGFLVTGDGQSHVRVIHNHPQDANTWVVTGFNGGTANAVLQPYALCV